MVVAQCWWPPQARGQRVAAARQLAGHCSRRAVQPRWPTLGLSPPRPHHHPLVFSASQLAPLVAAAAAFAPVAGTAWLQPGVVAPRMVAGLWPRSYYLHHQLKPDAGAGVGLQPQLQRPSRWMKPPRGVMSQVTPVLQLGLGDVAGSSFPGCFDWLSPGQGPHIMVTHLGGGVAQWDTCGCPT